MAMTAWQDQPSIFDWDQKLPDDWDKIVFERTPGGVRTLNGVIIRTVETTTTNYIPTEAELKAGAEITRHTLKTAGYRL